MRDLICRIATVSMLTIGSSVVALGQSALTAAEDKTAIFPNSRALIALDLSQEKVSLHFHQNRNVGTPSMDDICGMKIPRVQDHREHTLDLDLAAKEGKRSVIAAGAFTPGADVAYSFARFIERGMVVPSPCPTSGNFDAVSKGYDVLYVTLKTGVGERATADTSTIGNARRIALVDGTERHATALLGWNHSFGNTRVLGFQIGGGHHWNTPMDAGPENTCTTSLQGTDADGKPVTVTTCEDRFLGPLGNAWKGQVRLDYTQKVWRPAKADGPSLGVVAAIAGSKWKSSASTVSIAFGPSLHPKDRPSQILGAALIELSDLTNSETPGLWKRLNLRIVVGLPFD